MITKIYRVKGTFVMGDEYHKFTKEYKATSEADVEQKIYERFGAQGAPRDPRRDSRGERSPWLPLETRPDSRGSLEWKPEISVFP